MLLSDVKPASWFFSNNSPASMIFFESDEGIITAINSLIELKFSFNSNHNLTSVFWDVKSFDNRLFLLFG